MNKRKNISADKMPGKPREARLAQMIRVDHAGEFGAVRIYEGQLAVFRNRAKTYKSAKLIAKMEAQEQRHLETFDRLVNERGVRPTALAPLWHAGGYFLGAATALMGERAAMACTAAVEETIDEHYGQQSDALNIYKDDELAAIVEEFRADEADHRKTALENGAEQAPGYTLLTRAVKGACKVAIKLSEKV